MTCFDINYWNLFGLCLPIICLFFWFKSKISSLTRSRCCLLLVALEALKRDSLSLRPIKYLISVDQVSVSQLIIYYFKFPLHGWKVIICVGVWRVIYIYAYINAHIYMLRISDCTDQTHKYLIKAEMSSRIYRQIEEISICFVDLPFSLHSSEMRGLRSCDPLLSYVIFPVILKRR